MAIRLLVCGGRDYQDLDEAFGAMDRINEKRGVSVIIHGAARGADTLARDWAIWRNVPQIQFPADWDKHGRAAGPIRNQQMIDEGKPDAVLALPGGRGTADMMRRAVSAGIEVIMPLPAPPKEPGADG